MEARLYAEDPANGFLPSVGRLDYLYLSAADRVESGVKQRDAISSFYDPMIAKLVCVGDNRDEARAELAARCGAIECEPIRTNAWFLRRLLEHPAFKAGQVTTSFIGDNLAELTNKPVPSNALLQYAADDLAFGSANMPRGWDEPLREFMQARFGFRLNAAPQTTVRLNVNGTEAVVAVEEQALCYDEKRRVVELGEVRTYFEDGCCVRDRRRTKQSRQPRPPPPTERSSPPMPGKLTAVEVVDGQAVAKGDTLVVMEAMKMEQALVAPFDGTVAGLAVAVGRPSQGAGGAGAGRGGLTWKVGSGMNPSGALGEGHGVRPKNGSPGACREAALLLTRRCAK